ncbi:MAG: metalloregulator ArsR/SmtB family transcription factor [Lautropia sp.]|nr:metalloregulator ArsR/SmtB family transcription factor [Lautropia sp.]
MQPNPKPLSIDPQDLHRHASEATRLLKGLANENRLMILCLLAEGELSVHDINERIRLSQSALSQHLAVLRTEGFVITRRKSQVIYYSLADGPAVALIKLLHDLYCTKRDD